MTPDSPDVWQHGDTPTPAQWRAYAEHNDRRARAITQTQRDLVDYVEDQANDLRGELQSIDEKMGGIFEMAQEVIILMRAQQRQRGAALELVAKGGKVVLDHSANVCGAVVRVMQSLTEDVYAKRILAACLGAAIVLAVGGVTMQVFDLSIGEWFTLSGSSDSTE